MKLGDVATYVNGYPFQPAEWSDHGVPIIRIQNLTGNSYQTNLFSGTIDERYQIHTGDILISWSASLGVYTWKQGDAVLNQHIFKVVFNKSNVDKSFFVHQVRNLLQKSASAAHGATMKHLTKPVFDSLPFFLPSDSEQKRIAATLDHVSKAIVLHEQLIKKLDQLAKSRFIEMFGDPVENPKKWEKTPLGRNVTLQNGRAYSQNELLDTGKYPVLRVGNFFSNRGWYYSNMELEPEKYCDNGDLLYAWSASFGPKIWDGGKVIYHYHIWKVGIKGAYNKAFLCKLLEHMTSLMMKETHGIAMMHLTKSGMEQTLFILPPISLQNEFATFIEQLDKSKLAARNDIEVAA